VENSQEVISIFMDTTDPFTTYSLTILVPAELDSTLASCNGCKVSPYINLTLPAATAKTTIVITNIVNAGSIKPITLFLVTLISSAV
jgi:hypothetical protein